MDNQEAAKGGSGENLGDSKDTTHIALKPPAIASKKKEPEAKILKDK